MNAKTSGTADSAVCVHSGLPRARAFARSAIDAALAFIFLMLATLTMAAAPSAANPHQPGKAPATSSRSITPLVASSSDVPPIVEIATSASPYAADAVFRRTSANAAWVLLCLGFSLLAAFNLAIIRHMRRAYVSPRSRAKGETARDT